MSSWSLSGHGISRHKHTALFRRVVTESGTDKWAVVSVVVEVSTSLGVGVNRHGNSVGRLPLSRLVMASFTATTRNGTVREAMGEVIILICVSKDEIYCRVR